MTQARPLRAAATTLALASLAALGACKHDSTGPEKIIIPPDLVQREVIAGKVNVCVVGPTGDYTFSITREGGVTGGTLLVEPTFTLPSGGCRDVWSATPTTRRSDPLTNVTITGGASPAGTTFDHISAAATNNEKDYTIGTNSIVFRMNVFHGGAVTFFYKAATS